MLLVIGLDGATWDLAGPWIDGGRLPNLARLRETAIWGPLASTRPPATLPNWTTFMTGVNPGCHGIFDFTRRVPGTYDVSFVNSSFRKVPSVWRLLSEAGRKVATLGMPGTYPPEPVNGCMISGFDVPVATRADASFIYPPSLAEGVLRRGGFAFADFQEFRVDENWYGRALESLLAGVADKARLAEWMLSAESWDCFSMVFGETDTVAHHFWHLHDRESPRHDEKLARRWGNAIELVYRAVDDAIGALLAAVPSDCSVLIASDHGFGGAGATALHLNRWLAENGWLGFGGKGRGDRLARFAKSAALRALPTSWQAPLFRSFNGRIADRLESRARFGGIDWRRTRAFSEELNYFPSIWLNLEGRDPLGAVPRNAYASACAELVAALREWRDPIHGTPVVKRAWEKHEIFEGPWVDLAPDLILELADPQGYSYCCLPSGGVAGESVRAMSSAELQGGKRFGMSGSHRAAGMFLLHARRAPAEFRAAAMADMAPTMLRLVNVLVPSWMEGRPLIGGGAGGAWRGEAAVEPEHTYTSAEERNIEARLRALGYLA